MRKKCAIFSAHCEASGCVAHGRVRHAGHLIGLVIVPELEPQLVAIGATSHHGIDSPQKDAYGMTATDRVLILFQVGTESFVIQPLNDLHALRKDRLKLMSN